MKEDMSDGQSGCPAIHCGCGTDGAAVRLICASVELYNPR
jgi:hypothetical protein